MTSSMAFTSGVVIEDTCLVGVSCYVDAPTSLEPGAHGLLDLMLDARATAGVRPRRRPSPPRCRSLRRDAPSASSASM